MSGTKICVRRERARGAEVSIENRLAPILREKLIQDAAYWLAFTPVG